MLAVNVSQDLDLLIRWEDQFCEKLQITANP